MIIFPKRLIGAVLLGLLTACGEGDPGTRGSAAGSSGDGQGGSGGAMAGTGGSAEGGQSTGTAGTGGTSQAVDSGPPDAPIGSDGASDASAAPHLVLPIM